MVRLERLLPVVFLLSTPLLAQQSPDANRNYTINENGAIGPMPVPTTVTLGRTQVFHDYGTSAVDQPILFAVSDAVSVGFITTSVNSIDLSPNGLGVILDGTRPGPFAPYLRTNFAGRFILGLAPDASVNGTSKAHAMAHVDPASPDGFYVSQTHDVFFDTASPLQPGAVPLVPATATWHMLQLNDTALVPLGFNFDFYGTTYTQVYVNSNGNVSFGGSGDVRLPDGGWPHEWSAARLRRVGTARSARWRLHSHLDHDQHPWRQPVPRGLVTDIRFNGTSDAVTFGITLARELDRNHGRHHRIDPDQLRLVPDLHCVIRDPLRDGRNHGRRSGQRDPAGQLDPGAPPDLRRPHVRTVRIGREPLRPGRPAHPLVAGRERVPDEPVLRGC